MGWLTVLAVVLLAVSIVALAVSGALPPAPIQTFSHSSSGEHAFERRWAWLRAIGCIGLAVMVGVIVVLELLG